MSQYIIVTRFLPGHDFATLRTRAAKVKQRTASEVPELANSCGAKYMLLGSSISAIDIFNTDKADAVARVANIISVEGEAETEVLPAVPWGDYVSAFSLTEHEPSEPAACGSSATCKYAIITRFNEGVDHGALPEYSTAVKYNIIRKVPNLTGKWSDEFILVGGSFDGLDIVESDNLIDVAKAANCIRVHGASTTEVAAVVPWNDYLATLPAAA